jgi:hypothetical protein
MKCAFSAVFAQGLGPLGSTCAPAFARVCSRAAERIEERHARHQVRTRYFAMKQVNKCN